MKNYHKIDYRHILSYVEKPSRYINHEINAYHKELSEDQINFCLAFPEVYEVGISHLGIKILYSIINEEPDAMADRVYCPWPDFAEKIQKENLPLFGLETKVPLKDFDVIGFTLQTEQNFTNILYMLDMAGIPLFSKDRDDHFPLIIGGGINTLNPEPLADFFDAFLIGEGEEAIIEFKDCLIKNRQLDRIELLKKIAQIKGFYVPALYEFVPGQALKPLYEGVSETITARKYNAFHEGEKRHKNQLVPWPEGTHNRFTAEIMRGCTRGCRFCQAGMFYRPTRERSPEWVIEEIIDGINKNGWDEAGLLSLSSSDYSCIRPLLTELLNRLNSEGVSLALPSLRIDSIDDTLVNLLNQIRKTGLTLAPEAGTQRLRDVINKNFSEEEIIQAVKFAQDNGFKQVKLYFMVGLPFEEDEDIDGIINLIHNIIRHTGKRVALNITLSPFVPKPFTPFQWSGMNDPEVLLNKVLKIKYTLQKYRFIRVKYHTVENSIMEGIFSKADRRAGLWMLSAYKKGAILDGWNEFFRFDRWKEAAEETGFDLDIYKVENQTNDVMPWNHIDAGITNEFLIAELNKAKSVITTEDCRKGICSNCGACDQDKPVFTEWTDVKIPELRSKKVKNQQKVWYYRVYYSRQDYLQFVNHLDFLRMIHRILQSSAVPIAFSEGFNPHPKTRFSPPLAIGIEGLNEFFEIGMTEKILSEKIYEELQKTKIPGLVFHFVVAEDLSSYYPEKHEMLTQQDNGQYIANQHFIKEKLIIRIPERFKKQMLDGFNAFLQSDKWIYNKQKKEKTIEVDLKDIVLKLECSEKEVKLQKMISGSSIYDVLNGICDITRDDAGVIEIIRASLDY